MRSFTQVSTHFLTQLISGLAACTYVCGTAAAQKLPVNDVAITHVNVISMQNEQVLPNQTVYISAGKIVAVSPTQGKAKAKQVIDGKNAYLIPGLSDMHTHLGLKLPNDGDPSMAEMESDIGLYLPNGVTTIRNMRATTGILDLRAKLASGSMAGPELIVSGPSLHFSLPAAFGPKINTPEEAQAEVMRQKAAGFDLIKIHQDLPQPAYDAVLETAKQVGLPVAGHAQTKKALTETARLGSIEHMEELAKLLDKEADFSDPARVENLRAHSTYVTASLAVFHSIAQYLADPSLTALYQQPATGYASAYWREKMSAENNYFRRAFGADYAKRIPYFQQQFERLKKLTKQLQQAGIPLLLGTDAVGLLAPGFTVHQELVMLVEAGLSPYQALQSATIMPARWQGLASEKGYIGKGARADLVLLAANPLEDIRASQKILGVMRLGQWFDRQALDQMLQKRLR